MLFVDVQIIVIKTNYQKPKRQGKVASLPNQIFIMKTNKSLFEKRIELKNCQINGGKLGISNQTSVAETGTRENPDTCTDIGFDQPGSGVPVGYNPIFTGK